MLLFPPQVQLSFVFEYYSELLRITYSLLLSPGHKETVWQLPYLGESVMAEMVSVVTCYIMRQKAFSPHVLLATASNVILTILMIHMFLRMNGHGNIDSIPPFARVWQYLRNRFVLVATKEKVMLSLYLIARYKSVP